MVPPLNPDAVLDLLDNPAQRKVLATGARVWADANLTLAGHIARWTALIQRGVGGPLALTPTSLVDTG